jgi:hypothetical protein
MIESVFCTLLFCISSIDVCATTPCISVCIGYWNDVTVQLWIW